MYVGVLAALVLLLHVRVSHAATTGFTLERYTPTAPGETSFWVDKPYFREGPGFITAGLTLDYAHDPLIFSGSGQSGAIVAHELVGHFEAVATFIDRINVSLALPVVFFESGSASYNIAPSTHPSLGDPRVGATVRILNHGQDDAWSLHGAVLLWIPLGGNDLQSDHLPRVLPKLILSGRPLSYLLYSASVGILVREDATVGSIVQTAGNSVGPEVQIAASVGWTDPDLGLTVGPEAIIATLFDSPVALHKNATSLEILVGAHYRPLQPLQISLAAGPGILAEPGTPDFRVLLRGAWSFMHDAPVADRDGDGVADTADLCPDLAQGLQPHPHRPGCPHVDADGDGIFDEDDLCPQLGRGAQEDPNRLGCPQGPGDADNDGIRDDADLCPYLAQGTTADPTRLGCPAGIKDADGDGVVDSEDQCPSEAVGASADPHRRGCPRPDTDHDGVWDDEDACPSEAVGALPDPNRKGCPVADADKDGVPDGEDQCPTQPAGAIPDSVKKGCPGLIKMEGNRFVTQPVRFATGKAVILPESFPILDALVQALKEHSEITRISVDGHTDNQGKSARNLDLSSRRAASVMAYLVKGGIAKTRLESHGFGDKRPVAPNTTNAGRILNRRVEFNILH